MTDKKNKPADTKEPRRVLGRGLDALLPIAQVAQVAAAVAGMGLVMAPPYAVPHDGRLVRVLPEWKAVGAFAETIYAIRPYTPHVPRAVAALVEALRRGLAKGFGG
jgi:DNA-binding transcriptional LysR family regulator